MKFRIPILIPVALLILSLTISLIMFYKMSKDAQQHIRQDAINWQTRDTTRLLNILSHRLSENGYDEARLDISTTAMDSSIQTIFLFDENNSVLLSSHNRLEGKDARQIVSHIAVLLLAKVSYWVITPIVHLAEDY